jgi:hypothetical protein
MTSLLSSEDHTFVSLHKPCSTLGATVQLFKTKVFLSVICELWKTNPPPKKKIHCQVSFYATVMFLKNVPKIKHNIPI